MKLLKKTVCMLLCLVLIMSTVSVGVFADGAENEYENLHYKNYTYIGDSISWGYGLTQELDPESARDIFARVDGSYTDIVGKILEQNCGAAVHPAECSGGRYADYRMLLEDAMGVENPYIYHDDAFGNRTYERTKKLQSSGEYVVEQIKTADLITFNMGMNDLLSAIIDSLCACDFLDADKIVSISDPEEALDYVIFALQAACKEKDILGDLLAGVEKEFGDLRANAELVIKYIVELADEDTDILFLGTHVPTSRIRILPGTDVSPVIEFLGMAMSSLNDYFADIASKYENVYFVDITEASVFFPDGTLLTDAITGNFLLGIHPDAEGHRYIADRVMETLKEINVCHHTHTTVRQDTVKTSHGFGYRTSKVCADCGKVLDLGQIVTPVGSINVPTHTINHVVKTVDKIVSSVGARLMSLFGR